MKRFFKKKSLPQKHIIKQTKEIINVAKAPLIGVAITIADGATVTTTARAMKMIIDAIGEDKAVEWHSKYMDKFNKLTKQCYEELEDVIRQAKAEKCKNDTNDKM